ncbi:MAG: hypothetical protein ACREJ6_05975 [Candidatus Methylomirabilis sp.]
MNESQECTDRYLVEITDCLTFLFAEYKVSAASPHEARDRGLNLVREENPALTYRELDVLDVRAWRIYQR